MKMTSGQGKTLSAASLPPHVHDDVQKRLRRVEGQIRGVQRLLDEGAGCDDVIHQLAAAKAALDRVGYRLVAAGMQHCVNDPDSPMTRRGSGEALPQAQLNPPTRQAGPIDTPPPPGGTRMRSA